MPLNLIGRILLAWLRAGGRLAAAARARRSVGRIHFAGEATDYTGACATVRGALESGLRVARELLLSR
jgi:monoamine oxidase